MFTSELNLDKHPCLLLQNVQLNNHFKDILRTGEIVQRIAAEKVHDDREDRDLPRLIFTPVRARFGRFRQLIDAINGLGAE